MGKAASRDLTDIPSHCVTPCMMPFSCLHVSSKYGEHKGTNTKPPMTQYTGKVSKPWVRGKLGGKGTQACSTSKFSEG